MKSSRIFLVGVAGAALLASSALAENWPAWRGPTGQGVSTESGLPLEWSQTKNVRWKTPLPGPGNSTPIVWGGKVFINQASGPKGQRRELMCFDRRTGKTLWKKGVTYSEEETTHKTNPQCSGSPATDGERVVVSFSSGGVFCYDMNGKELWKKILGSRITSGATAPRPSFTATCVC
jgi:outer membrane protein assembly factor BamB